MTYRYKGSPTNRQLKVSELIRQEIAMIFARKEVYHPYLESLHLTVIEVKTSADLKLSTIFIYPVANSKEDQLAKTLNFLAPEYRKRISSKVALKFTPEIKFVIDKNVDDRVNIEKVLQNLLPK
ncbi:30S ribosome-binding factor RbfA [Candidatus Bandiella euplotis]|uniref:Ribosome-binding factor A n=1 Tax=Candidatus Bandiella euplotis TaxID=1664265 RepID=A0ABZ0ULU8_9RICK|nr:30S ribosome-binding factor RbfA [Candidatus Bandiella woodruffii]WPX97118.1 Ribosome-binding factor A [Candidatus Bandiella woodruffii]